MSMDKSIQNRWTNPPKIDGKSIENRLTKHVKLFEKPIQNQWKNPPQMYGKIHPKVLENQYNIDRKKQSNIDGTKYRKSIENSIHNR